MKTSICVNAINGSNHDGKNPNIGINKSRIISINLFLQNSPLQMNWIHGLTLFWHIWIHSSQRRSKPQKGEMDCCHNYGVHRWGPFRRISLNIKIHNRIIFFFLMIKNIEYYGEFVSDWYIQDSGKWPLN